MKICVLGAGVVGVSTAYALARQGHEVCVIEKGSAVASGASHANGAQLSYSYVDPFARPNIINKLPGYLLGTDPAIQFGLSFQITYLKWGLSFLRNCSATRFEKNKSERLTLAQISQNAMALYEQDLPKGALTRTGMGKLVLAQTPEENSRMAARKGSAEALARGQEYLTAEACLNVEPNLRDWTGEFFGGTYSPNDNALDPMTYCDVLEKACKEAFNVLFNFDHKIQRIVRNASLGFFIETDKETFQCEKVIVCLGNDPNKLLKPLGVKVPIQRMQGYSLTLPTSARSPKTSVTDLKHKIVFANLGDKMRIAGFLDTNLSVEKSGQRGEQLLNVARAQWPDAADYNGPVSHWTHYRPMTPSGVPIIGETHVAGLYLNAGHGALGYTFASGSAMKIATEIGHAQANSIETETHHGIL